MAIVGGMRVPVLVLLLGVLAGACRSARPPEYPPLAFADGLIVQDLVVPDQGAPVVVGDTLRLHYDLRLADGTPVESSRETGQTLSFEVGAGLVPSGLDRGVLGMRLFGRRKLTVPGALAFGAQGRPPRIGPDSTVEFEIELIEHQPAQLAL
jgi:FKBP-type peptidyl-prolyl cis-trans isomerase